VGDPLQDSFQKGFQDFLSSTKQLDGILAKAQQAETNPQTREALGQFLEMFRGVQGDLEKDLPGGVEEMVQDLRQGQKDMAAHMAKAGDLITKLEEIEQRANNTIEEGKARLAEAERLPQPPTAADLARQRLGRMAIRHGATGDLSNRPILKEGGLLQHQLLNLLQPKPDPQVARAKVIGNIWENWPKTQSESAPPAEEN
jgi:multidrug resistance efflux pump